MSEEEFDSLRQWRAFGTEDARQAENRAGRATALGIALWGRTFADLERQLLAARPVVPAGFELSDLHELQRSVRVMAAVLGGRLRPAWFSPSLTGGTISVGSQRFTEWEARDEIVRRAIEYWDKS